MPWSAVVIHEIIELDNGAFFEDMLRQVLGQGWQVQPSVNWIDGIAFVMSPFPDTDDVVREKLKGKLHVGTLIFTRIGYQDEFKATLNKQEFSVRLRKTDSNPVLVDLIQFVQKLPSTLLKDRA